MLKMKRNATRWNKPYFLIAIIFGKNTWFNLFKYLKFRKPDLSWPCLVPKISLTFTQEDGIGKIPLTHPNPKINQASQRKSREGGTAARPGPATATWMARCGCTVPETNSEFSPCKINGWKWKVNVSFWDVFVLFQGIFIYIYPGSQRLLK